MANTDNELKNTEVKDLSSDKVVDNLAACFNHQKHMQKDVYGYDYTKMTIGDIVDFCLMNKHAIEDEIGEFMDALGGINDGVGNAAWKPWKAVNKEIRSKKISDLSAGDLKELKMEFIDIMKFFLNFGIVIGMTSDEIRDYFFAKGEVNKERQKNGY